MRTALTIAGSDSIAGAGIQADLKTFAALGIHGASAVTAVTAQNTTGVFEILAMPPLLVRAQIDAVASDLDIEALKTGMLATAEIVSIVADAVASLRRLDGGKGSRNRFLVVDPVMAAAAAGRTLLAPEAVSMLKARLLPLATVVTPNVAEAEVLSGIRVDSLAHAREAGERILELGPAAVVVKGGHLPGAQATDLLFYKGSVTELDAPRANVGTVHGTGCTLASAIAARLATGDDVPAAVQYAKRYVTGAIERSFETGHGARLLNHFWQLSL